MTSTYLIRPGTCEDYKLTQESIRELEATQYRIVKTIPRGTRIELRYGQTIEAVETAAFLFDQLKRRYSIQPRKHRCLDDEIGGFAAVLSDMRESGIVIASLADIARYTTTKIPAPGGYRRFNRRRTQEGQP